MTYETLYAFLFDWLTAVLPDGALIIESYQDGPAPLGRYVAIEMQGTWDGLGQSAQRRAPDGASTADQVAAFSTRVADYEVVVSLIEVDGDGEYLRTAIESLETQGVGLMFTDLQVSVLRCDPVIAMPTPEDKKWRKEHRVQMFLHIARTISDPKTYIETVEIEPNLGG